MSTANRLSPHDRTIVHEMTVRGISAASIARTVGCTKRTVERVRAEKRRREAGR